MMVLKKKEPRKICIQQYEEKQQSMRRKNRAKIKASMRDITRRLLQIMV